MELHFNIHDAFRFVVNTPKNNFMKYISKEFDFFKSEKTDSPDLVINIGKFRPNNAGCSIINNQYFIKKNYLYCRDAYKVVKWEVEFKGIEEGPITVNFNGNRLADSFLCRYVIEPLMRIRMNENGMAFVHSSGVSDGKNGFLFAASKGVAKTTTILNLVAEGGIFLSDDFTILSKNGYIHSYPTTVHLFQYNISAVPAVRKLLKSRDRMNMVAKNFLYRLSMGYGSLPLNINVSDIFGGSRVGKRYPLKAFIFLEKSNTGEITIEKIRNTDVSRQIVAINKLETFNFLDYMLAYTSVFPDNKLEEHWAKLEETLNKGLYGKPCYKMTVPKVYTPEVLEKIKALLVENGYKISS